MSKLMKSRKRLALAAVTALVISGVVTAMALANITPAGVNILMVSTNSEFTVATTGAGTVTVKCEVATAASKTKSPASKEVQFTAPKAVGFHDVGGKPCNSTIGAETATVATSGTWKVIENSATEGEIEVGGATITISTCTVTVPAGTKVTGGKFTEGKNSEGEPSTIVFKEANVTVTGVGCGTVTSPAKFSGVFTVADGSVIAEAIKF